MDRYVLHKDDEYAAGKDLYELTGEDSYETSSNTVFDVPIEYSHTYKTKRDKPAQGLNDYYYELNTTCRYHIRNLVQTNTRYYF